jgi:hypothetical protein
MTADHRRDVEDASDSLAARTVPTRTALDETRLVEPREESFAE